MKSHAFLLPTSLALLAFAGCGGSGGGGDPSADNDGGGNSDGGGNLNIWTDDSLPVIPDDIADFGAGIPVEPASPGALVDFGSAEMTGLGDWWAHGVVSTTYNYDHGPDVVEYEEYYHTSDLLADLTVEGRSVRGVESHETAYWQNDFGGESDEWMVSDWTWAFIASDDGWIWQGDAFDGEVSNLQPYSPRSLAVNDQWRTSEDLNDDGTIDSSTVYTVEAADVIGPDGAGGWLRVISKGVVRDNYVSDGYEETFRNVIFYHPQRNVNSIVGYATGDSSEFTLESNDSFNYINVDDLPPGIEAPAIIDG